MSKNPRHLYEFGPYRLDTAERLLLREGRPVQLTPKAFETLVVLISRGGRLVEKDELMKALWPDSFVEESNLTNNVWTLRKILGEAPDGHRYIETVPRRGYRFTAAVKELSAGDDELVVERHTFTRLVAEEEVETTDSVEQAIQAPPVTQVQAAQKKAARRVGLKLKLLALGLACLVLAGVTVALYKAFAARGTNRSSAAVAADAQPLKAIAVLPFKSMDGGSENEYLGLGLADALITRLGNVRQIEVRPTSAVRRYTDANQDPVAVGRHLDVDAVLDGDFQRDGNHLRITVQLIRVADGSVIWSSHFDQQFSDIFSVQDAISEQVACDLVTRICGQASAKLEKQKNVKIEAYEAYLKGRYFWGKRDAEGIRKGIEYFNQAIAIEPDYAEAHAALGGAYAFANVTRMPPAEAFSRARAETQKALELNENLPDAHATLGLISINYDWDWATAERELKRALELNPNNPTIHDWYAEYLNAVGRQDEAVAEIERARELDPLSAIINSDKCKMLRWARRYNEAIEQCKRTLELDPAFEQALSWLGDSYWFAGAREESLAVTNKKLASTQNPYDRLAVQAVIDLRIGKRDEALKITKQLEQPVTTGEYEPGLIAALYTLLGDNDKAFAWLEKAYASRSTYMVSLKSDPTFDSLHSDERFADLLRRVGLQP